MAVVTRREKFYSFNTLVCLVEALEGHYTTVDLRNETYVYGKIKQADPHMNILVSDAIFVNGRGEEHSFKIFSVQSRNIRYVHIPPELSITSAIKDQLQKMSRKKMETGKRTLKMSRSLRQQAETLQLIQERMKTSNL